MLDLNEMTLTELKELAKQNNIKNISKLKKEELIIVLKQVVKSENSNIKDSDSSENIKVERQYDENGNSIVDYKLTNEGDSIVEGILEILPDGYGFLRGDNYLSSDKDVYISTLESSEGPQLMVSEEGEKHKKKIWIMNSITNECRRIDATDDIPIG